MLLRQPTHNHGLTEQSFLGSCMSILDPTKAAQARWFKTRYLHPHSSGAKSPRSRYWKALFPPKAPGEGPSCLFQPLGALVSLGLWLHHPSVCLLGYMASPCVSVSKSSSYKDTSHCTRATPLQCDLFLANFICKDPISK